MMKLRREWTRYATDDDKYSITSCKIPKQVKLWRQETVRAMKVYVCMSVKSELSIASQASHEGDRFSSHARRR